MGFSQKTCFPARAAAITCSACRYVGDATTTRSMSSLAQSAGTSGATRTASSVASGSASAIVAAAMARSSAPGRPTAARAWVDPAKPVPMTPMRSGTERTG